MICDNYLDNNYEVKVAITWVIEEYINYIQDTKKLLNWLSEKYDCMLTYKHQHSFFSCLLYIQPKFKIQN